MKDSTILLLMAMLFSCQIKHTIALEDEGKVHDYNDTLVVADFARIDIPMHGMHRITFSKPCGHDYRKGDRYPDHCRERSCDEY